MEHVINANERKYAFSKFIIFFTITVATIVGAVYFDTLIPQNENAFLRQRIAEIETQEYKQREFILAMKEVKNLNDSLNKLGTVDPRVQFDLEKQLKIMNNPEHQEGRLYGTLNQEIFNIVYDLSEMNKKLINLNKELQNVEHLKNELSRTKIQLEEANRSLDTYRNSANLGLGSQ